MNNVMVTVDEMNKLKLWNINNWFVITVIKQNKSFFKNCTKKKRKYFITNYEKSIKLYKDKQYGLYSNITKFNQSKSME